jgi:hypothetical protein
MTSDEPLTELELRALREMREHWGEHKADEGQCATCDLWRAWLSPGGQRARLAAVDVVFERYGLARDDDLPTTLVRSIQRDWGEGDWTSRGLK